MRVISNILFYLSIAVLVFWIVAAVVINVCDLEFIHDDHLNKYLFVRFYSIPVAILLTLFRTLRDSTSIIEIIAIVLITLFVSYCSYMLVIIGLFANMCGFVPHQTLFDHKHNPNKKIIACTHDCGALDSSPTDLTCIVSPVTSIFKRISPIDTTQLDESVWIRR